MKTYGVRAKACKLTEMVVASVLLTLGLLWVVPGVFGQAGAKQQVVAKGSDTIVNLASAWAEAYMKLHPDASISVTGGGSGTGIAAMLNRTCDIANSSRRWTDDEKQKAAKLGITPVEHIVGYDGICVVVNKNNPVETLTLDQMRKIFNGSYRSWRQVGGPDEKIGVVTRDTSSGTYVFFQEDVLMKDDYATGAKMLPSNAAITSAVTQDRWSIGYVGLGYALTSDVKTIKVKKSETASAMLPSVATVLSGEYPISRPLLMYTNGQPSGATKDFVEFAKSADGQKIVQDMKFVPLKAQ
jgi:phosphate transport system substrate-binding protein